MKPKCKPVLNEKDNYSAVYGDIKTIIIKKYTQREEHSNKSLTRSTEKAFSDYQ